VHGEREPATRDPILARVTDALGSVVRGKAQAIELVVLGVLAGGHVLLEDVPGVGKTTLAKALARVLGVGFTRVQFTPDLLPADITGSVVLSPLDHSFKFHKGPIFTHVLLADEINRASPRTQAALLEAMNEAQVSVDGETHKLEPPFFVIATQNPADFQGTYPLPEAQLDRFLLRVSLGYPGESDELEMLYARKEKDPLAELLPVCEKADILRLQEAVAKVDVKPLVGKYIVEIVRRTRDSAELDVGVSPRGTLAFFRASQARAFMRGRAFVSPEDVQTVAASVLSHRVQLKVQARHAGVQKESLIASIVKGVPVPT
jgi:MoxR-like ATPase